MGFWGKDLFTRACCILRYRGEANRCVPLKKGEHVMEEVVQSMRTTRVPSSCASIYTSTVSSGNISSISSGHSIRQRCPL